RRAPVHARPLPSAAGRVLARPAVPLLDGAAEARRGGFVPAAPRRNLDWVRPHVRAGAGITEDDLLVLADAQTSGGLLVVGEVPGYPVVGETVAGDGIDVR